MDPCKTCTEKFRCMGLCKDKMKYINDYNIKIPEEKPRKKIEYNKNGIRREEYR